MQKKTKIEREGGLYERFYIDKLKTYARQEFGDTCVNEQKHQHYIVCACPGTAKRALVRRDTPNGRLRTFWLRDSVMCG